MSLCQWPLPTHSIKSSSLPVCFTISLSWDVNFLCINRGHVWHDWKVIVFFLPSSSSVVATEQFVCSIDTGCNKDNRMASLSKPGPWWCIVCLQVKLEEALKVATDFHNSLQDFINWLTQAEQTLNMVSPASLILETIMFQIDEHKVKFSLRASQPLLEMK